MPSVISVKGMRKLIDELTENVVRSARKLSKVEGSGTFEAAGSLVVDGKFFEDVEGELSFDGALDVEATVPVYGAPAEVGAEIGGGLERTWHYGGKGPMKLAFHVKYKAG
jgi:hypothetical protein